jgi:hypothetical protein
MMNRRIKTLSILVGLMMAAGAAAADGPGAGGPPPDGPQQGDSDRGQGESATLSGVVEHFNLDRRGSINGIIIKDGDHVAQLNFGPDESAAIGAATAVGQKIQATAMAEWSNADHPVYRLQSLTGADGKKIDVAGPQEGKSIHVDAAVKYLNYSPRGDVDGAILDNGDFLQLGPGGAEDVGLAVGQKIAADGTARPMSDGHNLINADKVNGTEISHPRGPGGPDGGPGGPGGGGPGGGPGGPDGGGPPPGN